MVWWLCTVLAIGNTSGAHGPGLPVASETSSTGAASTCALTVASFGLPPVTYAMPPLNAARGIDRFVGSAVTGRHGPEAPDWSSGAAHTAPVKPDPVLPPNTNRCPR